MNLIRTNDGMMGWKIQDKMIWVNTRKELYNIGWAQVGRLATLNEWDKQWFIKEVDYALDVMAERNMDTGVFGLFGSFMYPTMTEDVA